MLQALGHRVLPLLPGGQRQLIATAAHFFFSDFFSIFNFLLQCYKKITTLKDLINLKSKSNVNNNFCKEEKGESSG